MYNIDIDIDINVSKGVTFIEKIHLGKCDWTC